MVGKSDRLPEVKAKLKSKFGEGQFCTIVAFIKAHSSLNLESMLMNCWLVIYSSVLCTHLRQR